MRQHLIAVEPSAAFPEDSVRIGTCLLHPSSWHHLLNSLPPLLLSPNGGILAPPANPSGPAAHLTILGDKHRFTRDCRFQRRDARHQPPVAEPSCRADSDRVGGCRDPLCNTCISREFTKGGLVKGGLAIYALHLCDCNTLGSVFNAQIENVPNC